MPSSKKIFTIDQSALLSPSEREDASPSGSPLTKREQAFINENILEMRGELQIDSEFKDLKQNATVKFFLHEIQCLHIFGFEIDSYQQFYLLMLIFILPCVWSLFSVFIVSFPEKLWFDSCWNPLLPNTTYSLYDCFICCNNRGFVFTHLLVLAPAARIMQIVTMIWSIGVALASMPVYSKLMLQENVAIFLLSFGVTIRTEVNACQLLPVFVFGFLCAVTGILYCVTQSLMAENYQGNSPLGYGDVCANDTIFANQTLYAVFNEDNPCLRSGGIPTTVPQYFGSFALIFVPFVPILLKMWIACKTTFSRVGLEHLVKDNIGARATFDTLKYEVEEGVLMDAIEELSDQMYIKESCGRFIRRFMVCRFKWNHPLVEGFGLFWGFLPENVMALLTILKKNKTLEKYKKKEKVVKVMQAAAKKVALGAAMMKMQKKATATTTPAVADASATDDTNNDNAVASSPSVSSVEPTATADDPREDEDL